MSARSESARLSGVEMRQYTGWARNWSIVLPVAAFAVSVLVAAAVLATTANVGYALGRGALHLVVVAVPVATGAYAMRSPRTARFGAALILIGLSWSLSVLSESDSSVLYSTGRVIGWLMFPLVFWLLLAYPEGRISDPRERILFRLITSLILVLFAGSALISDSYPAHTPWAGCVTDCPPNAFRVIHSEPGWVHGVLWPVRDVLSLVLLAGVTAALLARRRAATRLQRLTTAPVTMMSIAATVTLAAFFLTRRLWPDNQVSDVLGVAWALCLPGLAAAFWLGFLRRRLFIARVLGGLTVALNACTSVGGLAGALRGALGDAEVHVFVREHGRWVHEDGEDGAPDDLLARGWIVRTVTGERGPLAAVAFDPDMGTDDELIDAVVSLTEAALRRLTLSEELEHSLHQLEASRQRIATAASVERQRIERDLHDGAQQRLIALRMRLSLAEETVRDNPDRAADALRRIGDDVDRALQEIRSLAQGIYPAILSDRGLTDALRSAAHRSHLPVRVKATGVTRHTAEIEGAVYFACLEALQNVAKHAPEARWIRIRLRENDALRFEVSDDGPGFDPSTHRLGTGLANMRDRVEALGGRLVLDSRPGEGTIVRGMVPMGSGLVDRVHHDRARDDVLPPPPAVVHQHPEHAREER